MAVHHDSGEKGAGIRRGSAPAKFHFPSRWVVFLAVIAAGAILFFLFREKLSLESLVESEAALRQSVQEQPVLSATIAFVLYVIVTAFSLPFALLLTFATSWLLQFAIAVPVISFASTTGATLAMLASRYFFQAIIRAKLESGFGGFLQRLDREGKWYLASMRLAPPIPFFVVNLLAGLTLIRIRDYWWISQLCMLPATIVFCWVGASLPDLAALQDQGPSAFVSRELIAGLTALAILPLVIRRFIPETK